MTKPRIAVFYSGAMKTAFLAIFSFACICQAEAFEWTITDGNSLIEGLKIIKRMNAHENLTDGEIKVAYLTGGYLRGFSDSSLQWSQIDQNSLFKLPKHGIPLPQFVQVIEKFLTDNTGKPQLLQLPADGIILAALVEDFPNPALQKNDATRSTAFDDGLNDSGLRGAGEIASFPHERWNIVILGAVAGLILLVIIFRTTGRLPRKGVQQNESPIVRESVWKRAMRPAGIAAKWASVCGILSVFRVEHFSLFERIGFALVFSVALALIVAVPVYLIAALSYVIGPAGSQPVLASTSASTVRTAINPFALKKRERG